MKLLGKDLIILIIIYSKISRLETYGKKKEIKENIKSGFIDIIIGSHSLLSDEITFKKLGLIIVDEEQSFGVQQKEKLKKIKPNTHILTLSATPILKDSSIIF